MSKSINIVKECDEINAIAYLLTNLKGGAKQYKNIGQGRDGQSIFLQAAS